VADQVGDEKETMDGNYKFGPDDQLPLSALGALEGAKRAVGLGKLTPAQADMLRCFNELPSMAQGMLKRDAMRSGFILGRDLLAAKRDYKTSDAEEYSDVNEDSTEIAADDDEYESLTRRTA
jgi:hypothetical protein